MIFKFIIINWFNYFNFNYTYFISEYCYFFQFIFVLLYFFIKITLALNHNFHLFMNDYINILIILTFFDYSYLLKIYYFQYIICYFSLHEPLFSFFSFKIFNHSRKFILYNLGFNFILLNFNYYFSLCFL